MSYSGAFVLLIVSPFLVAMVAIVFALIIEFLGDLIRW